MCFHWGQLVHLMVFVLHDFSWFYSVWFSVSVQVIAWLTHCAPLSSVDLGSLRTWTRRPTSGLGRSTTT